MVTVAAIRSRRSKACRVCSLPASELDLVNGGILSGWSARRLAERFGTITRKDVAGHMRNCVSNERSE